MAVEHGGGGQGDVSIAFATAAEDSDIVVATAPRDATAKACWFQAAHIFKAASVSKQVAAFPLLLITLCVVAFAAVVPFARPLLAVIKLPDRPPPTQPLLQIFRI